MPKMTWPNSGMSSAEYSEILLELGLNRSWAGATLAKSEVTGRRWCQTTRIPDSAAIVLRLMRARVITIRQVIAAKKASGLRKAMGPYEYTDILNELGLSRSWVGRTLANSAVTGRRWSLMAETTRIPDSVAVVLRLMREGLITVPEVMEAKNGSLAMLQEQPAQP